MLTCLSLSFLIGCASTGSPSGGPRDTTPPSLVIEKSSKNFSTNFSPEKLELVFDEWIELKNQQREILISPPFFKNPKITSRGKKITIEFPKEEPLREDATYTINFGKSIVDFTESNAAEGFRFVFATGDKIDSLGLSGSIKDAKDDKPVKDILVLLYDRVGDSVVVSEKPFYYARTDESGSFKFENLKNDTFKLLVLEDLNFNYLLDPELERLAFPDSLLILNDSASYNPILRLFKPEQSTRVLNSNSQTPGLITSVFNKQAEEVDFNIIYPDGFDPLIEKSKDTLLFWFSAYQDSVGVVFGMDTLDFTIKPFDSIFYDKKLLMVNSNASKTILAPFDSLRVSFSAPLAKVDTTLIRLTNQPVIRSQKKAIDSTGISGDSLLKDSIQIDSINFEVDTIAIKSDSLFIKTEPIVQDLDSRSEMLNIDKEDALEVIDSLGIDSTISIMDTSLIAFDFSYSTAIRNLIVNSKWKEKDAYRLELLPGAITDIYGRQNDSLLLDFKTAGLDEFGNITINLSGLDSAQHYVVLLKQNDEIISKSIIGDSIINKIEHKRLRVNTYSIELIKDDDSNGVWTTGDYWSKRQPEELKKFELEKLRENWDLEADVFWNDKKIMVLDSMAIDSLGIQLDSTAQKLPSGDVQRKNPPPKSKIPNGIPKIVPDPKGKND